MMQLDRKKAQASVDMLIAYGIAILIVSIALYVVLELGIFNNRLAPTYCNTAPSFSCAQYAIATNGNLTLIMSQSTTGDLNISGIACSTEANSIGNGPKYGNVGVADYANAISTYPTNQLQHNLLVYPSQNIKVSVYCYTGTGVAALGLGQTFTGYVWFNYTINNLPSSLHNVQQVVSVSAKYT